MRQLKDIEIFYAFHFASLPKNEHESRTRPSWARLVTVEGVRGVLARFDNSQNLEMRVHVTR